MSLRVLYVIVVTPLFGTHWSCRPPFQAACVSFHPCGGSGRNVAPMLATGGRKGSCSPPDPLGWCHTLLPDGRVTARGSPNPRTPLLVPKYWSKDLFSWVRMIMCSTS